MGWKCTPQLTGLVRGEPKKGQKHRSNVKAICAEAGKERITNSATIDRSRSHLNKYTGFESGFACADDMEDRANNYRQTVKGKGGAMMERALRNDAVIGCAIIYNPPEEVCRDWTDEQYSKFYSDSDDFMNQICPSIFRKENVVMESEHYDEGTIADPKKISRHKHKILDCIAENGKYCGNLVDSKLLDTINRTYPQFMRSRGWEMDDLDVTDWDRCKTDTDYKTERKIKRKKSGKDVNGYIAEKLREQLKANEDVSENLKNALSDALQIANDKEQVEQDKIDLEAEKEGLRVEREQVERDKKELEQSVLKNICDTNLKRATLEIQRDFLRSYDDKRIMQALRSDIAERTKQLEDREREQSEYINLGRRTKENLRFEDVLQDTKKPNRGLPVGGRFG